MDLKILFLTSDHQEFDAFIPSTGFPAFASVALTCPSHSFTIYRSLYGYALSSKMYECDRMLMAGGRRKNVEA